jgi:hypothetical protein
MKYFILTLAFGLISCNQSEKSYQSLEKKIDSLEAKLHECYKPGFGELMGVIQTHHAKLWFAGINENWQLADFETHEIDESLESIRTYQKGREETELIEMIYPSMKEMKEAITSKNTNSFKDAFNELTNMCNSCHRQTHFEYNKVKVPDKQFFSNQEFKP